MRNPATIPNRGSAVVTYVLLWDAQMNSWITEGERPHCAMVTPLHQCGSEISVTDLDGTSRETCTRESLHTGPHVVHEAPGLPILAWLVKR